MAIQRQAEDPGQNLLHGEAVKYSLSKTAKTLPKKQASAHVSVPASPGKDILYTVVLFAIAVGAIALFSLRFR